jgi:hypothetical protein
VITIQSTECTGYLECVGSYPVTGSVVFLAGESYIFARIGKAVRRIGIEHEEVGALTRRSHPELTELQGFGGEGRVFARSQPSSSGLHLVGLLGIIFQQVCHVKVAMITGGTTILVATITVTLGRYYERKRDIEAQFRAEKIKIYDQFFRDLFMVFHEEVKGDSIDVAAFLRVWQRKLVLWGGPDVLRAYFHWVVRLEQNRADAQTMFSDGRVFRALRSDIDQSLAGSARHLALGDGSPGCCSADA